MPNPVSAYAVVGKAGDIHTSARNTLGARYQDETGQEYIYLQGIGSTLVNLAVTFNATTFITALSINDAVGFIAIATAAVVALSFGWYQVYGFGSVVTKTSIAAANGAFLTNTAGALDDASVAGDFVNGFLFTGVDVALLAPCHFSYPYVTNTVPA